jgi:hypothetical protein
MDGSKSSQERVRGGCAIKVSRGLGTWLMVDPTDGHLSVGACRQHRTTKLISSQLIDGEVEVERTEAALYPKDDSHHNPGSHSDKTLTPVGVDPVAANPHFLHKASSQPALPALGMTIHPCKASFRPDLPAFGMTIRPRWASDEPDIGPVWFPTGLRKAYALVGPNTLKLNQTKVPHTP